MVRESHRESYALLARYGEALKIFNLGTHYDLEIDPDGYFQYVYMALGVSIRGFLNSIRSGLVYDVFHYKENYKGIMLVVVSI